MAGRFAIGGSELHNAASRALHTALAVGITGAQQHATARFASVDNNGGPRFGLVLRAAGAGNYYTCYRRTGGSSSFRIAKVVNGKETVLKSSATKNPSVNALFSLGCRVEGSKITLEFNGANRISVSDTTFTTGGLGLFMGYATSTGKAASHRADDFNATAQ
jgi:hypothetical protein